ncbi:MAG TPA: DUF2399 domain-containing protein [Methylomusa anaerophila]|uniref:DUF2399 domain-containing protein n=1 Tax=Methylomusa anaerophila TaxID=1930071 RepID=A0A348AFS8_9FIRM|nr:DUF2399 domain-containing protein [Methylomusa anaerophila]BBB89926.1 hypothetical protein MAMMFC1_00566 [Methylomusa anaerophila]HML88348.1 DUF2399 domain-containing protein [Methylomusa anaerophila]
MAAGIQAGSIAGNSGGNGKYATGQSIVETLSATEEISELLYQFNLLRDDMLNFATCFGLAGYDSGQEVVYWRAASEAGAPLNLPLREIVKVTAVKPLNASWLADGRFDVFVVENSGVFSALLDKFLLNGNWDAIPPLICLHGQFKLASWALLERLAQSGARFLYSGDFDPEGLQMAQKLLGRYPGKVCLWRMKIEDYQQATPSVPIEDMRLNKLRSVTHPELMDVNAAICEQKLAAYQEGIIELLFQDINDKLTH